MKLLVTIWDKEEGSFRKALGNGSGLFVATTAVQMSLGNLEFPTGFSLKMSKTRRRLIGGGRAVKKNFFRRN